MALCLVKQGEKFIFCLQLKIHSRPYFPLVGLGRWARGQLLTVKITVCYEMSQRAPTGETRNAYNILVRKTEGKRTLGRRRGR
jgi:hypothetical protein